MIVNLHSPDVSDTRMGERVSGAKFPTLHQREVDKGAHSVSPGSVGYADDLRSRFQNFAARFATCSVMKKKKVKNLSIAP